MHAQSAKLIYMCACTINNKQNKQKDMPTKLFKSMNIIRCVSGANLNLFRYAAMVLVLLVAFGVGNAWAGGGSSDYYASLKITQSGPTGAGSVYVANSNSKPGTANPGTAVKSASTTSSGGNVTMYWWVDINPGYNVSLSGKVTGGPYSAASASGNVSCAASGTADGTQAYTATATFVAVTVNSVDAAAKDLEPTNPSIDYPFTVTFETSNLKTIALDLDKSPETADGKFTITSWTQDGNNVVATGKFNGGGSYGGASRNNSTTVSLQSKASGSTAKTCTVTANFPALAFVGVEATEVYATQGESGKTGSATFTYNYGAEDDFPTAPTIVHTSGSGAFAVTGYTVTPNFSTGVTTVTVNYEFNTNNGVGETVEQLKLTAANGLEKTITITGHSEALATNDASVTPAGGSATEYATFAQALAAANNLTGATLTLLRNVDLGTITATNNINKAMTIDLNGKELRAAVNATDVGILTIAKAVAVTIKDSKTGGKIINEIARNSAIRTIFVNKAGATLTLESGTIAVNNLGQYASAANSTLGVAKYANCTARAIHQIAGTTVNINGGRVEAYGTRSVYGIVQASSVATNVAGTSVLNITNGEIYAEGPYAIYGICAYGKVNFSNGAITTHVNTNMVDARYAADAKENKYNGNGYGIYMGASANAAAASCYYGTLEMTGGTVSVTNDRTLNGNYPNYGVYLYAVAANVSSATAVAADGKSRGQIASAKASIDSGEISVISGTQYSHGVHVLGSYNSYDNTNHTVQIKNCKITSKAYVCAYGVSAWGAINTTNGACYAGDVELTNCDIYAESLTTTTAAAVWVYATSATIFKDGTTTNASTWGGEFAVAGKAVINSGKYEAKTKTTTAYGAGTSLRAKTTYDAETTVATNRKPGGNAEAYPILIIHGGTFKGTTTTTSAYGVSNGGYTTIDGGTFEAFATTTNAYGLYTVSGKLTASGVTVSASATGTAYGAYANCAVPGDKSTIPTGFAYAGELELNNCDITATTRTSTEARGVFVNATNQLYNWTKFHSDSASGSWKATTTAEYYRQIYPCTIAGHDSVGIAIAAKATINGCDIKATAATTTAYGVYSTATSVPASADSAASPVMNIKNTKFTVKTNGTTTAYGMYAGGPTTIDGCDFTVQPKTTTAYGVYVYDKKTTITNTKFDVKGTNTVYGLYANAAIGSTTGWDYHGEFELGEGNDLTAAATGGNTSHVLTLIATKRNIASGRFAGNYANAASAHITGGKYKATATGTTSYVLNLSDQQVQGDVISRPACIIEDGKFWALASGGTTGICTANGQIGHIVFKGGFYNVNTNLAKYKEEGKNVNDVLAGTPEYTEGYRYKISSELSGAAVCKVYTNANSPSLRAEYATLEEALQYVNANTGTNLTIVMIADYTLKKGDYLLPSNATLVIPNDITRKSAIGTTPSRQNVNTPAPVQLIMLTFDAGVNMTVKGTIETSAVNTAANGGSAITGAPTGNYGRLHLVEGSTITLESGANLNCWGYTTGKGEINALNGSTVREGFQLGYWRGGSATSDMLSYRNSWHAFPVTDYFIQNVEAPITFRPGAQLLGYSGVNVSIVGIQAANSVKLVGTSASMFLMEEKDASEDTYVRKEYDPETDRAIWTVNSGAKIGSFSFSLAGNTVNSADYYLPISNNMTIYVNEGEFTITQDALLIPGAQVIISKLGKLTVASGKRLFVMDNEDWPGFLKSGTTTVSRWYYNALYSPSWTTNPRTLKYPPTTTRLPDGEIFVHGETEGSYYTSTSGANIHSTNDDAGKVKFVANAGADNSIQHVVNTDNERVTINFTTAQLKNETPETPYTSSKNTVAGEAFVYMEQQWVKVTDGCLTTRTDGSGTHEYAKPSDVVEVVSNGDNAYRDVATNSRYFINAEEALSNAQCVWWEVEPVTSGIYAGDYMANQEKYENYGAYYYWDGSAGYWKPRYVTVTWKNQDGTTLATYTNVMCNTSPKYLSASPTWANTSIEKHDWVGWRDADGNIYDKNAVLPVAQGNVTYTAYYNVSKYEYTIKFVNPDKTVIWAGLVEAGTIPECPVEPTQAPTVSTVYTFTGWNTTPVEVTGTATYTAVYASSTRKYHVTFYNYDAQTVLYEADVDYNTRPVYAGVTPFRANTSSFSYEWTGWQQGINTYDTDDDLDIVTGNVNYIATYSQMDLKYQVFFKRQDGSIIDAPLFNYEETPAAFPANPTLASTVSTDYTFDHWEPAELVSVTEEGKVYTAYFSESPRQYTAHFVNYDGKTLGADQTIDYNTVPVYTGATPFHTNDSRNSFDFSGWAWEAGAGWEAGSIGVGEAFPAIKGDITFTAQFTPVLLQFNVIYQREDGTIIEQQKKKWGETTTPPSVDGYQDQQWTYTFAGWTPSVVSEVTADATYTATFNKTAREYTLLIAVANMGYGTVSPSSVSAPYGATVTTDGNVLKVNGATVATATPATATAQYTYAFDHWNNVPATVTGNISDIEAVFTRTVNQYEVTFNMKGHGSAISEQTKDYGSKIDKPSDPSEAGYTFGGWYKESTCTNAWDFATDVVIGETTLFAKWAVNQYTITFDTDGGSAVASITQDYSSTVTPPANPTRTGYTFAGWLPDVPATMPVDGANCVAQWTINSYQIKFVDEDGTTNLGSYPQTLDYGAAVTAPEEPTKAADATNVYTFAGWSDGVSTYASADIPVATAAVTYTATYNSAPTVASVTVGGATTYYATLQAAFNYAADKTEPTIKVLADIALTAKVTYTNTSITTVTFDLNGHKVSGGLNPLLTLTSGSKTNGSFVIKSSVAGGQIRNTVNTTGARSCVVLSKGKLRLESGTIYIKNSNTGSSYAVNVASGKTFTMTGGTLEAEGKKNVYALYTAGSSNISGGTIKVTQTTSSGYAAGVHVVYGTTTITDSPTITVSGTKYVNGVRVGGLTPAINSGKTAVTMYNGVANIEGGTYTVTASTNTAYGVYCYGNTFKVDYATNATLAGNYANGGTANVSGGEFSVTSNGATAYGVCLQTPATIQTALDADGNATYDAATTHPKANITGGKFNVSGTSSVGAVNTAVPNIDLVVEGGWYNDSTNLGKYTAPAKSCNYHVLDLPEEELPYKYKVAEAYTVTFKDGDNNTIQTGLVEKNTTPAYTGATPTKTATARYTYTFNNTWSPAIVAVEGAATYTAQFNSIANTYTIIWKNGDDVLETDENVTYGTTPSYDGATPVSPDESVQYTYPFTGWTPSVVSVTENATYTATFGPAKTKMYPVVWKDWNGTTLREKSKGWGWQIPEYDGATPSRAKDGNKVYTFAGWSEPVSVVENGDVTYTARYALSIDVQESDEVTEISIAEDEEVKITTVEVKGKLNVAADKTLTTDDLILEGTPSSSGEITGEGTVAATRALFDFSQPGGFKAKTWYAVAVPWQVAVPAYQLGGVYIKKGEGEYVQQTLGSTFDLIYYNGELRATGASKAWNYVENDPAADRIMVPGRAYMIYLVSDADTIRFERKADAPLHTNSLKTKKYAVSEGVNSDYADWNGIANPATYHAYLNVGATEGKGQVYNPDTKQYEMFNMSSNKLVVGQPIFVQPQTAKTVVASDTYGTYSPAPRRAKAEESMTRYELYLAPSMDVATDRIIVRMSEDKETDEYIVGQDLAKMGVSSLVPQMWVDRYDSKMCINTAIPTDDQAYYPLGISVPQNGEYDIFLDDEPDSESTLYLTYDGEVIWNLSYGFYVAHLEKGTNTHYGLRIVKTPKVATGIDNAETSGKDINVYKIIVDDKVFIIRGNQVYGIDGRLAK